MWQIYKNQSGSLFQVNCPATLSEPNANRLLFITSDTQLLGNSTAVFTALSCNPTYSIDRAFVNINQSGVLTNTTIDPSNSPSTGRSANFSAWDVTMAVIKSADLASLGAASSQITTTSNRPPEMYCSEVWQDTNSTTLLSLAISAVPGLDITNAPMLQAAVQRSYRIIAAQIAKQNLMLPADETIPGTQTFTTQRIFIRQLSLRIMEVAFSILIIVTLIVVVSRPCRSTPEDMSTIGRLAIVMAQSPSFVKIMRGLGSTNIKRIGSWLSGQNFRTVIAEGGSIPSRFSIEPLGEDSSSAERTREREEEKIDWWRPLPIRLIPRLGTLLVTALIVVALEVLLYFSRRDNGLAVVNTSNYDHYAWTYIPGVVMSSLHLLYGVIDFSTRVVQPYVQLKKRPSTAGKTIFVNYLSHLTVIAAWKSILNKHFMVLSTAVTMLLAPFLTIVASGLFTAAAVPYHKTAIVTRGNTLNTSLQGRYSAVDSTMTGNITLTNSLIIGSNMSYPTWTHDGLVFPSLSARIAETSAFAGNDTMNATALTTRVPALYTSLNCTQLNIEQVHLFTSVADTILFREITLPVPSDCGIKCIPHASENMCTDGSYDFAQTHLNGQHRPINGSFFGKVFEAVPFSPPTRPDCPRLLAVYGRNSHDSSNIEDMVALSCSPFTSQVQVDATFSLPDWTAVATTVDPTTQSKVGMDALYPFHDYLPAKNVSGYDYDPAFAALAYGRDSIPVHQLLGPENAPKVMDALERLYARWAAQALNIIARVPAPPDAATLDGMLVFENQMRLQQSVISTRILEVLLLLMFLCVVITLFQIDTKRLLPNNPCSIGATAALIAESEMVNADNSPGPGVEWYSEKKLKGIGLYEGSRFSLDWWDRGEGEERRYGIDVRDVGPVP
jgi:hypothetical protein